MKLIEYIDKNQKNKFNEWFNDLDAQAAAFVTVALTRLENGNRSNLEPIGEGASELKINKGAGFRVYLGFDGEKMIILLAGGTKKRQQQDIEKALSFWREYKKAKVQNGIDKNF